MSTIHFIGGEKGGVGKSVVARLCAQYCIDRAIPFVAADADGSHGALLRFYSDYTRPIDLSEYESADAILGLATESERRVLVDLPAQSDRLLSAWIQEAGMSRRGERRARRVLARDDDGKDALITPDRLLSRWRRRRLVLHRQEPGRARLPRSTIDRDARRRRPTGRHDAGPARPGPGGGRSTARRASFWAAVNGGAPAGEA
jgi:hypothetical protein